MPIERCDECGFDGADYTDAGAIAVAETLPSRWAHVLDGLAAEELQRRPIVGMWSIAEYTDHVRETAFGMRFVLDTVLSTPDTNLGDPPEPRFDSEPRSIDVTEALTRFRAEITELVERLRSVPPDRWHSSCTIGGDSIDVHWLARHIVHDVTHHLGDVDRLRRTLQGPSGP